MKPVLDRLVDQVERELRADIATAEFPPTARLRVAALVARYNTGATPVREALTRLAGEGLIEVTARRGFRVPDLSRDDLLDILAARNAVEGEALRLSMERGDDEWEAGILAALHRFRKYLAALDPAEGTVDSPLHDALHAALTAAAGSPRLSDIQRRLILQHKRYLQMSALRHIRSDYLQEHVDLVEVVLSRDADAAVAMLRQHLRLSLDGLDRDGIW